MNGREKKMKYRITRARHVSIQTLSTRWRVGLRAPTILLLLLPRFSSSICADIFSGRLWFIFQVTPSLSLALAISLFSYCVYRIFLRTNRPKRKACVSFYAFAVISKSLLQLSSTAITETKIDRLSFLLDIHLNLCAIVICHWCQCQGGRWAKLKQISTFLHFVISMEHQFYEYAYHYVHFWCVVSRHLCFALLCLNQSNKVALLEPTKPKKEVTHCLSNCCCLSRVQSNEDKKQ